MQRVRWRWILPLLQVGLAIWLIQLGTKQEDEYFRRLQADHKRSDGEGAIVFQFVDTPGYVAPAHQLLGAINFMPTVAAAPIVALMPEQTVRTGGRLVFLPAILAFWFWMGWLIDTRAGIPRIRARPRMIVGCLLLLFSLSAGVLILHSYWGHAPMAQFWSLLWCIGFVFYSTRTVLSGVRDLRNQPSVG